MNSSAHTEDIFAHLESIIQHRHRVARADENSTSYTVALFKHGAPHIRRKIIEEAGETITAESSERLVAESADLIYHLMVYWEAMGVTLSDVRHELQTRMGSANDS